MKNTYIVTFEVGCCTSEFDEIDGVVIKTEPFEMTDFKISELVLNHLKTYMNLSHFDKGPEFKFEIHCLETGERVRYNLVNEAPSCGLDIVYNVEKTSTTNLKYIGVSKLDVVSINNGIENRILYLVY